MLGWFKKLPEVSPGAPPDPHTTAAWFKRRWVAVDQLLNVWLLNGLPDETISSNAGRQLRDGRNVLWAKFVCWFCEKIDSEHCKKSIGH